MESAIPDHLKTARTRHTRYGDDYTPPYPGFVARHKPTVSSVVMAYFGLQFRPADEAASAAALARLTSALGADHGPGHWEPRPLYRRGGLRDDRDHRLLG